VKYIIGAYTTAPSLAANDKLIEYEFYENLIESIPNIRGLEIPFWGNEIHQFGSDYLLNIIDPDWENVISCIPGTMLNLAKNPKFGLASDDENGRIEAIAMHKRANLVLHKMNKYYGKKAVIAVQVATAPSSPVEGVHSSVDSLLMSMQEILSWDWQGAKIVIEHCDSAVGCTKFEKGFLTIEDEIKTLIKLNGIYDVGITINWARSAIEGRSVETPIEHIQLALDNNILSGIMFSGVSDNDNQYGSWKDMHMPFSQYQDMRYCEPKSLLSYENISNCISLVNPEIVDYLGIKILSMPIGNCSIDRRVGVNRDAITILNSILDKLHVS
jgi:hypothetical protein